MEYQVETPVVFVIHDRHDLAEQVYAEIRRARPSVLYVVADGARSSQLSDVGNCEKTRALIDPDWDCEVIRDFSDENLGCQERIISGLNAFFEQFERGIVLEDDCLPCPDFFRFCDEMLERYEDSHEVAHVGGSCFLPPERFAASYTFSRHLNVWGWATWRGAWSRLDCEMAGFLDDVEGARKAAQLSSVEFKNVGRWLSKVEEGRLESWAYRWLATQLFERTLSVVPSRNLVSNVGFDSRAVHTKKRHDILSERILESLDDPLCHPDEIKNDVESNSRLFQIFFRGKERKPWYRRWFS